MRPIHSAFALLLVTACAIASSQARAAVQCANHVGLAIPADGEGLYVNLITGVSGRAESAAPGFDIDIYASTNSEPRAS